MTSKGQESSSDSTAGMDYIIRYSLNEFQRGSIVTRFETPPDKREVFGVLERYDISSTQVSEYSVSPARGVQQALTPVHQDIVEAQPSEDTSPPPLDRRKRKSGCGWVAVAIVVIAFVTPAVTAERSYTTGQSLAPSASRNLSFGERYDFCDAQLRYIAVSDENYWDEAPGFFEDRVSNNPIHPANLSFLVGCMSD